MPVVHRACLRHTGSDTGLILTWEIGSWLFLTSDFKVWHTVASNLSYIGDVSLVLWLSRSEWPEMSSKSNHYITKCLPEWHVFVHVLYAISFTDFWYGPAKGSFLMSLKGFIFSLLLGFTNKPWEIHRRSTIVIVLLKTF